MLTKLYETAFLLAAKPPLKASDIGLPSPDSDSVFNGLLGLVYWGAGLAAVFVIIIAGIIFVLSEGMEERITRARKMIQYAVVGLIVILIAATLTQFVIG